MENAIFVVLGWLLGLISPRVVDSISKRYRQAEIKRTLLQELQDLRVRLAMTAALIAIREGTLDRKLLEWLQPIVTAYKGFYADPASLDAVQRLLTLKDEEVSAACKALQKSGRGFSLKKFTAPFLTTHLSSLAMFSPEFERVALEITSRFNMLNDEMDAAWFFFTKTFDPSLPDEMLQVVIANVNQSYQSIGRGCRDLGDMIGRLIA